MADNPHSTDAPRTDHARCTDTCLHDGPTTATNNDHSQRQRHQQQTQPARPPHQHVQQPVQNQPTPQPVFEDPLHPTSVALYSALAACCAATPDPSEGAASVFQAVAPPPIAIVDYARRIVVYGRVANVTMHVAAFLLLRYTRTTAGVPLAPTTAHRLIIAGVALAAKTYDDYFYTNEHYARVGGITARELNRLEFAMFVGLHFSTLVNPHELQALAATAAEWAARHVHAVRGHCAGSDVAAALDAVVECVAPGEPFAQRSPRGSAVCDGGVSRPDGVPLPHRVPDAVASPAAPFSQRM